MALAQRLGPANRVRIAVSHVTEAQVLVVARQMALHEVDRLRGIQVGRLICEVKQEPELEAGIRNSDPDTAPCRNLLGFCKPRVPAAKPASCCRCGRNREPNERSPAVTHGGALALMGRADGE